MRGRSPGRPLRGHRDAMRFDRDTLQLIADQAGVVSRRQLLEARYRGAQIDAMLRRGHLRRIGQGIYLRTGVAYGPVQRAVAAMLRARVPARVTGELLLALIGCEGYEVEEAASTVLLARPCRLSPGVGFSHRVDPAPGLHRASFGAIAGTTPARTIVELAVDLDDDEALLLAADRLRWRCHVGAEALARTVEEVSGHPGARRLRRLGLLDVGRPESPGERRLASTLHALGIEVEWQVPLAPGLRVDALWRERGIVLEYDGPTHDGERDRHRDRARDGRLRALGYEPIHLAARDLDDPVGLAARLFRSSAARDVAPAT